MDGSVLAASIIDFHRSIENWGQGHGEVYTVPTFLGAEFPFEVDGILMKLWGFG